MNEPKSSNNQDAFDLVAQEGRIVRAARMLDENERLQPNQREDISERVLRFIQEHGITQAALAREVGIGVWLSWAQPAPTSSVAPVSNR